ncbi:hypothetical protein, partial [Alistipes indistinctus]
SHLFRNLFLILKDDGYFRFGRMVWRVFFGAGREVVSGIGVSLSAKPEIDSDDAIVDFFSLLLDQQ